MTPAATCHLVEWYAMELCFLFKVVFKTEEFWTTLKLSHKTFVGESIGTPNIRNLNRKAVICSMQTHIAINLLEKVLASTVFCLLLNHIMGALLKNITNLVWPLQVTLLAAWDKLTYSVVDTEAPLGSRHKWSGSCSSASLYWSWKVWASSPSNYEGSIKGSWGSK